MLFPGLFVGVCSRLLFGGTQRSILFLLASSSAGPVGLVSSAGQINLLRREGTVLR